MRSVVSLVAVSAVVVLSARAQTATLPSTAAGRCASAYFRALNARGDEALRVFLQDYHSPAYLERHPIAERLAYYQGLRDRFGRLTPIRVALSLEQQLTVLVAQEKGNDPLVMRFHLDSLPARYLSFVTISAVDHPRVPDEYVTRVADRAAPVGETLRDTTIRAVAAALRSGYVFPALGQQMAEALLRRRAAGGYREMARAGRLADQLTEDLAAVAHDRHVWVEAQNPLAQASADPTRRPIEALRQDRFGVRDVTVLPGNIGVLKLDVLLDLEEALRVAAAALDSLAGSDALILDLRDNVGGGWRTAGLVLGYLFPAGTVFAHVLDRDGRPTGETRTAATIPGRRFDDRVPVYVLTSGRTASAAEGLAYILRHSGRATIVGEVTVGAAHPSEEVVVNDYFRMSVPRWRSVNVVTGTDWEGSGVVPHTRVEAARALDAAVADARRRLDQRRPRPRG